MTRDLFSTLREAVTAGEVRTEPSAIHRLGPGRLAFVAISASAPFTVLAGGVVAAFAVTGDPGMPLALALVAAVLALFVVGYAALSARVVEPGGFYSYLRFGFGQRAGVAGGFVALLGYAAIQVGLYGLFGASLAALLGLPWWACAVLAWVAVAVLGVLCVEFNAAVLCTLLAAEVLAVLVFDVGALSHPAAGDALAGLAPSTLGTPAAGALLAFAVACFVGFESSAMYSAECRDPRHTVARATWAALAFCGVFYTFSAWALTITVGPSQVGLVATDPGLVFTLLADHWGRPVAAVANLLFLTSIFAALLSFHNAVARYLHQLGRDRVLPVALARETGTGAPLAGSVVQSLVGAAVIALFAAASIDPVLGLFTWSSGLAAVAVVALLAATSAAAARVTTGAVRATSTAAALALAGLLVVLVAWFGSLVGDAGPALRWGLPAAVAVAAVAGAAWPTPRRAAGAPA